VIGQGLEDALDDRMQKRCRAGGRIENDGALVGQAKRFGKACPQETID